MNKLWQAKWITSQEFSNLEPINVFHKQIESPELPEHHPSLKNYHMLVRKEFMLNQVMGMAYVDISADDYYKLYVNGRFVTQGPAPSYYFHYFYNRIDVTDYLTPGVNLIAVHVYYQGLVNRVWNSGDYRQGMIAELVMDGRVCLKTDASWKYTRAMEFTGNRTYGYETQFAEDIDCRIREKGWQLKNYDDRFWKNAAENLSDDHSLVLQPTLQLDIYETEPAKVIKKNDGHYLLDFGQEITGQFQAAAKGEKGQSVTVMCGEELDDSQEHVRYNMRCNCDYKETWTLSGGEDTLDHYDYKAFRYVELEAPDNVLQPDSFRAVVRHYPLNENMCRFETSNPLLNEIWKICKNGVKFGSQEVYVDCPSREKGQYLGDATVTSHAHAYLSGDLRLWKKCLQDFALSTRICPGLMAVAPGSYMQEIADFSLQWPYQLLNYYQQSGDLNFLKQMLSVAEGILAYFHQFKRQDGLLENVNEKWNLVDWPQNLRDDYDFDLSTVVGDGCHNVINAFYIGAVKTVEEIREILEIPYRTELPMLKKAYVNAFLDPARKLFTDSTQSTHSSLHANMLPLFFHLVPDEALKSVVELIRAKRLKCGVYNTYFLLKGLASAGEYDLIYELLTLEEERSWANMLREGATTCFEAWGKEQKWNTSLCHPWASAPISVMIEDIIGVKPAKPGWKEIHFEPHIPSSLKYLFLEFHTVQGKITVEVRDSVPEIRLNGKKIETSGKANRC